MVSPVPTSQLFALSSPSLKENFDGGARDEGSAAAWVLFGRKALEAPWRRIASSGVHLGHVSAADSELTAAREAVRALEAYVVRDLTVDSAGWVEGRPGATPTGSPSEGNLNYLFRPLGLLP